MFEKCIEVITGNELKIPEVFHSFRYFDYYHYHKLTVGAYDAEFDANVAYLYTRLAIFWIFSAEFRQKITRRPQKLAFLHHSELRLFFGTPLIATYSAMGHVFISAALKSFR